MNHTLAISKKFWKDLVNIIRVFVTEMLWKKNSAQLVKKVEIEVKESLTQRE